MPLLSVIQHLMHVYISDESQDLMHTDIGEVYSSSENSDMDTEWQHTEEANHPEARSSTTAAARGPTTAATSTAQEKIG